MKPEELAELQRKAARWQKQLEHVDEQTRQLHRWSIGALLSVNGGALVVVLSAQNLPARAAFFSSLWFFCGLATTLLFVLLYTKSSSELSIGLHDAFELCDELPHGNTSKAEILKVLDKGFWDIAHPWIERLQYLSFGLFLLGASVAGYGVRP